MIFTRIKITFLILPFLALRCLFGQPVATLSLTDVSFPAYFDSVLVPVVFTGPMATIAGLQFDIVAVPPALELIDIFPAPSTAAFNVDFSQLDGDTIRVIIYNTTAFNTLPAAADTILWLRYDGSSCTSARLNLEIANVIISDTAAAGYVAAGYGSSIAVGSVVELALNSASGNAGEQVTLVLTLTNPDTVGSVRLILSDTPDYLTLDSLWLTDRLPAASVTRAVVAAGDSIVVSGQPLAPGDSPILNLRYTIAPRAYAGEVVIALLDPLVRDNAGGDYLIAGQEPGRVEIYPGYLEPPSNLVATTGLDRQVPLAWAAPVWTPARADLMEGFENSTVLPADWLRIVSRTDSWKIVIDPEIAGEGSRSVGLPAGTGPRDEWLITAEIIPGDGSVLTFWSLGSEGSSAGDHYYVKISPDGGASWDTLLDLSTLYPARWNRWDYPYEIALDRYRGQRCRIAWQAVVEAAIGSGAAWMIDAVRLAGPDADDSFVINDFSGDRASISLPPLIAAVTGAALQPALRTVLRTVTTSPVDFTGYNLYRSTSTPVVIDPANLLATLPDTATGYLDEQVVNGNYYYYSLTADYGELGESAATNEVAVRPEEWIELLLGSGSARSGFTDTVDVFFNNESEISAFTLTVADWPDYL
ncbi:MAG: choice-of-anchor J domain-containing protein, partial [Candidatus Neomarinimicrobiota bacterium]